MKNFTRILSRNPVYFSCYAIFAIITALFCSLINKGTGFLDFNRFHFPLLDYFFILITNLGDGLFTVALMIFFLMRKKTGWAVQIILSFLFSGLLVQILKKIIASARPKVFFGLQNIHYFDGITRTGYSSFPSGHSATIFALTTLFSIYFTGRKTAVFLFSIALLIGFSRVYLSDHFPIDVLAGSLIGVIISIVIYQLLPLGIFDRKTSPAEYDTQSINLR